VSAATETTLVEEGRSPTNRIHKHAFLVLWPWSWPWPDDLKIRTWPIYFENVPAYLKTNFLCHDFKDYRITDRQTDTQTGATENITIPHSRVVIIPVKQIHW